MFSRQLGFDYGTSTTESYYGNVPPSFAIDNIACGSNVSTIQDCSYEDETTEDCEAEEGAGVICHYVKKTSTRKQ